MILIDIFEKDEICDSKYKSIKKSRNKMIEIWAKSNSRNLPRFRFENIFEFKKTQYSYITKESNFLIFDAKIISIKLK